MTKQKEAYGGSDVIINSSHPIGTFEGKCSRSDQNILVFNGMTLEFWVAKVRRGSRLEGLTNGLSM
jgi:hypothetical protein